MGDPVLVHSWMPVTNSSHITSAVPLGLMLLDTPIVLWRSPDGVAHAARDQCPHRGAALSLGQLRDDTLMCGYHGWVYDSGGRCVHQPASPGLTPPPKGGELEMFDVCERYGVVFVAIGQAPSAPPDYFPEWDEAGVRHYHDEPVVVHACGPRIVENFLDMAHFPFVHPGVLGAESHTEVRDYRVTATGAGIEVTDCVFWQPAATPGSTGGADVAYRYRVPHPYVATLSKSSCGDADRLSLMVMASPLDEEHCRAWIIGAFTDPESSVDDFVAFNHRIFLQDVPILESQRPRPLPLEPTAELTQRADRASTAYRRWLADLGLCYGTIRARDLGVTEATDDHLRRLPKVELHCHVEGAARASTIADLARRHGVALPVEDPADLFEFTSLNQFLSIYDVICASLRTADDFRRITYEALEDGVAAGVRYREMFFSPGFVIRLGVPVETVWEGIKAGVLEARADLDITCRMILDFDKPTGPAHAIEMAAFAGSVPDRDLLVGMGADSVERGIDHSAFAAAFIEAARYGLRRTIHAGEDGPSDNIAIAVRELGCERIDHGFRLLDDADLTAEIVERQIPLDVCPTSNVVIANVVASVAEHPFARQRAAGVLATLNSDDPGMMRFDIADEYVAVAGAFGYSLEDMEAISLDGVDACWAPDDEKRALRDRFAGEFDQLRDEYGLPRRPVTAFPGHAGR